MAQAASDEISRLPELKNALTTELHRILGYWLHNMQDHKHGGFLGRRLWDETLVRGAPKSAVLNTRLLWTFSAAARATQQLKYTSAAHKAFQFITRYFVDQEFGGVYWSVSFDGHPLETKKQVYAQSFAIYALAEYYQLTGNENARQLAIKLYQLVETHSYDTKDGGYIEAFTRQWKEIADVRLSEKDANEKKTMNTHLHVLEAYTNLFRIFPDQKLEKSITRLLEIFFDRIIDDNHHLVLFFNEKWQRQGQQISYGHDIEAAWLLHEAALAIGNSYWIRKTENETIAMVDAAMEGLDKDHGLWHEYNASTHHLLAEKHWWPQAEAMVGFFHAWQCTSKPEYLQRVCKSWEFIKNHLVDTKHGEWIWGIHASYEPITTEDKAGFWKCPYHNGRACLELISRIDRIINIAS